MSSIEVHKAFQRQIPGIHRRTHCKSVCETNHNICRIGDAVAEHISEVLSRLPPSAITDMQDADVDIIPTEWGEIMSGIRSFKNGKATGHDSLSA